MWWYEIYGTKNWSTNWSVDKNINQHTYSTVIIHFIIIIHTSIIINCKYISVFIHDSQLYFIWNEFFRARLRLYYRGSWISRMCSCKQVKRSKKLEGSCITCCQLLLNCGYICKFKFLSMTTTVEENEKILGCVINSFPWKGC